MSLLIRPIGNHGLRNFGPENLASVIFNSTNAMTKFRFLSGEMHYVCGTFAKWNRCKYLQSFKKRINAVIPSQLNIADASRWNGVLMQYALNNDHRWLRITSKNQQYRLSSKFAGNVPYGSLYSKRYKQLHINSCFSSFHWNIVYTAPLIKNWRYEKCRTIIPKSH